MNNLKNALILILLLINTLWLSNNLYNNKITTTENKITDIEFSVLVFNDSKELIEFLRDSYDLETNTNVHVIGSPVDNYCQIFVVEKYIDKVVDAMYKCTGK